MVTTFNSISDIWNIMKQRKVSPVAQLLDLTEDCWSQAGLGEADILWPLIGQYWDHHGLPLVEILQKPEPIKLHQQQCAMKLGNFVVNYIKSTFKIAPAKKLFARVIQQQQGRKINRSQIFMGLLSKNPIHIHLPYTKLLSYSERSTKLQHAG
mgnify:CR=1 FL=1